DLRGAISRNEIVVYFQPQENLSSGKLHGMEALVRWKHQTRGLIPPIDFIGLAEETGQIWEIGRWILHHSCQQLQDWLQSGYEPVQLAVNLSSKQLVHPELINEVGKILKETGLPAKYLELEITESVIMENPEDVIGTLEQLKSMGVQLAIDDFGTGYSSLNYLRRFPIDVIKIDRSFVSDITENQVDADIVNTIIALAHIMGVKVVAEGVETALQKELLKQQSCDIMQGYYLSKPIPAAEFAERFLLQQDTIQALESS
ncbi:EAL domain-containing protein, partial [bacterium AH-315-K03]|nr:EAL domain-containing protein [bacterium AH-315-K03]